MNISYLTMELIEYIEAPMPYIVGVPRFIWKEVKKIKPKAVLSQEAAIFDLNKGKLTFSDTVPDLPLKDSQPVYKALQEIAETGKTLQFSHKLHAEHEKMVTEYWTVSSLKVKEAFFMMFVKLMGDYLRFFDFGSPGSDTPKFDFENYVNSLDPIRRPFVTALSRTQNFASFIEKTQACCTASRNEVSFFVEGSKVYAAKGEKTLEGEIRKIFDKLFRNYRNVYPNFFFFAAKN